MEFVAANIFAVVAFCRWYVTLVVVLGSHAFGLYNLARIIAIVGPLMSTAVIFGVVVSIATYVISISCGIEHRMSGNIIYDIFMGAPLNPRIGCLDLKIFAEIRVPWTILFFLSVSAAISQYQTYGSVSTPMVRNRMFYYSIIHLCCTAEVNLNLLNSHDLPLHYTTHYSRLLWS